MVILDFEGGARNFAVMRLDHSQISRIRDEVDKIAGAEAAVFVYGSRLDHEARGGDVDLLIRTAEPVDVLDQARLQMRLEEALLLPFDLVFVSGDTMDTSFKRMIYTQARPLAA